LWTEIIENVIKIINGDLNGMFLYRIYIPYGLNKKFIVLRTNNREGMYGN